MLSDSVVYIHFITGDERCEKTVKATEKLKKKPVKLSLDLTNAYRR